jgi:hypothetical protein
MDGGVASSLVLFSTIGAAMSASAANLLSAPIQLSGTWGGSPVDAAGTVLNRSRDVFLQGLRLVSDRQPSKLLVDDHASGPPAIWLHGDPPDTAWLIVDIGGRDWCKLAYQFGHELGHMLCNS